MSGSPVAKPLGTEYFLKGVKNKFHENVRNLELFMPIIVALYIINKKIKEGGIITGPTTNTVKYDFVVNGNTESVEYKTNGPDLLVKQDGKLENIINQIKLIDPKNQYYQEQKKNLYYGWRLLIEKEKENQKLDETLVDENYTTDPKPTFITVDRVIKGLKFILDKRNENDRKTMMPGYGDYENRLKAEHYAKYKKAVNDILPKFQEKLAKLTSEIANDSKSLQDIERNIKVAELNIAPLQKKLQENNTERAKLTGDTAEIKQKIKELNDKDDEIYIALRPLKANITDYNAEKAKIKPNIDGVQKKIDELNKYIAVFQKTMKRSTII